MAVLPITYHLLPITYKKYEMRKEWFANWFDSPYYHILYQKHNEQDAKKFLDILLAHLTPQYSDAEKAQLSVLDLACGKGRHSRYMASKGFDVTGIDLAHKSIKYASQFEKKNLTFFEHDMRKPFRINYFDFILNIFTSFGYFDKEEDNLVALKNVCSGLKADGVFILDYFNSEWVRSTMQTDYHQETGGINFHIQKHIENGHIFKTIEFEAHEKQYRFQEKVRLFSLKEFEILFDKAGLKIIEKFGDYQLNPFNEKTSNRLIIKAIHQ